jgi:exosortase
MTSRRKAGEIAILSVLVSTFLLQYFAFFKTLLTTWLRDPQFSYGILIPGIVAYLIWRRRSRLATVEKQVWNPGLSIVLAGCALQVLASRSGSLLISGAALALSLAGAVGYLWGKHYMRIVALPLAFLMLMVPLPSYVIGGVTWDLQVAASTISAFFLSWLGVPVYQDGNLLRLPNYTLEVQEACSGSRSICALLAMALVLGMSLEKKWRIRIALIMAAPLLAIMANVIRIAGTGLLAWRFGELAANESLHSIWGMVVFMAAAGGLLGFHRLLQWATIEYA